MPRYWDNPKRIRFRALIDGYLDKHPDKPLPTLAHYAKLLNVDIRSLREWARQDFSDLYPITAGWITQSEMMAAAAAKEKPVTPPCRIELADPDPRKIAAASATFDEGPPW